MHYSSNCCKLSKISYHAVGGARKCILKYNEIINCVDGYIYFTLKIIYSLR